MKNSVQFRVAFTLLFLLFGGVLFAQEDQGPSVSEQELQGPAVNFENRNNRLAPETMRSEEFELGESLARGVLQSGGSEEGGIRVQRIFHGDEKGFGADIIEITENSNFGHINRINRILAGYIQTAFEYDRDQGMVLGRFILDYNGRNRGNTTFLKEKYSPQVQSAVPPEKTGIAISYREWPGKTFIVIPLGKNLVRPDGADVNRDEISEDSSNSPQDKQKLEEIDEKRNEEDLTRLDEKEKELEQKENQLKEEQKELQEKQEEIDEQIEQEKGKLDEIKKDPDSTQEEIDEQKKKVDELDEQQKQNEQKQDENQKDQEEISRTKKEIEEQKEEISEGSGGGGSGGDPSEEGSSSEGSGDQPAGNENAGVDPKSNEELKEENEQLKEKIQEEEQKSENVINNKILVLRVIKYINGGHYNNELWQIDPVKDDALMKGPFTNICGREFYPIEGTGVLVVGYESANHTDDEHRLILLDPDTLKFQKSSAENVHWRTPVLYRDDKIYVIEIHEGQYYLSRFQKDLSLDARSEQPINPDSDITFFNEKIYVTGKGDTGSNTTIKVFNREKLTHVKTIKPGG